MSRICPILNKGVLVGMNVSHAHNRNKRRFIPNLQVNSLISDTLGITITLRLTVSAIRTIEKYGGLDQYLLQNSNIDLPSKLIKIKKRLMKIKSQKH